MIKFTKYGHSTISIASIVSCILIAGTFFVNIIFASILWALALFIIGITLNFFRDPERETPVGDKIVVSPADGKILLIKEVIEQTFIGGTAKQISVFMSPLNVHVNRIPISGVVKHLKYHKGKFLTAFDDKASEQNERSEIGIESHLGKIFYTQVAGFVARRIITDLKVGEKVEIGKRFGMIKFGSRVDIIVPLDLIPQVKPGDKVTAGKTILFIKN